MIVEAVVKWMIMIVEAVVKCCRILLLVARIFWLLSEFPDCSGDFSIVVRIF